MLDSLGDKILFSKKVKVQLSLMEEAEWMPYFEEHKQKTQELKAEIDKTDKEESREAAIHTRGGRGEIGIVEGS